MPHQVAVTVQAPLRDGRRASADGILRELRTLGADDRRFPFPDMSDVHFARLFVLDGADVSDGPPIPDSLIYMADVDGSVHVHLRELASRAGAGIDATFGLCDGYPSEPTPDRRLAWLQQWSLRPAAYYVHTVGRTVARIQGEASLQQALGRLLDDEETAGATSALAIRRRLAGIVVRRPDLAWGARRPRGAGFAFRLRETVSAAVVPLALLPLLPLLLPVGVAWILLVRWKEHTDWSDRGPADRSHVAEVEAFEDFGAQNPFTAAGFVKPGFVRRTTMRVALAGLGYACRHLFSRDNLAGVRTIHFARWLSIDDGRRVIFASSYDGSQESYMDDFIDRLHWGVNLVFSNGVGYPSTRWLITGGARDEVSYKQYLRKHQVPTTVFYSAYPSLSAQNVDNNSMVRGGLCRALDEPEAARWLARV